MTLLGDYEELVVPEQDADALIPEARRRKRRRRAWIAAVVLAAASIAVAFLVGSGGGGAPVHRAGSARGPARHVPGSQAQSSSPAASAAFGPNSAITGLAFPSATEGFAVIDGYSRGQTRPSRWLDRTGDGGRSWTATPGFGADSLAFNTPAVGWAWGTTWGPAVSMGTRSSLFLTTDAGRRWHRERLTGVVSLVTTGAVTWMIKQSAVLPSGAACRVEFLRSTSLAAPPTALADQPPVANDCNPQFWAPTGQVAYALYGSTPATSGLTATDDGGISWQQRPFPCRADRGADLYGTGTTTLWLRCAYGSMIDMQGDFLEHVYRSVNGGLSWMPVSAAAVPVESGLGWRATYDVVSPRVAWAWSYEAPAGPGDLQYTADAGRHWRTVFPHPVPAAIPGPPPYSYPEQLMVGSASSAWLAVGIESRSRLTRFVVGHTADRGATWTWSHLRS